ncbi:MAG: superoxide dismutase family protein [Flavonifractor plautii]
MPPAPGPAGWPPCRPCTALWQQRPPRPAGRGAVLSLPGRNPIADTRPGAARGRLLCLPHSRARRLLHRGRRGLSLRRSPLRSGRPRAPEPRGDLPVLLSSGGRALSLVYTGRFQPGQVLGRSVVLHALPDDYRSQPTGAAGGRIACGVISPVA